MLTSESMQAISLTLPQPLLDMSARFAKELHISRAEYIRRAILRMNREMEDKALAEESQKVRQHSMRINREFSPIDPVPDA